MRSVATNKKEVVRSKRRHMSSSILSLKPGHDGSIAHISDGQLQFSVEAEKDAYPRYSAINAELVLHALALVPSVPDILCISGFLKGGYFPEPPVAAGYYGWDESAIQLGETSFLGKRLPTFSSSHERSHLMCGYGLSPFPQGEPCYALVWEGNIGSFYEIDEWVRVHRIGEVLSEPGVKYSFLFMVGDPTSNGQYRPGDAGKLMALAAFGRDDPITAEEQALIELILSRRNLVMSTPKEEVRWSVVHNAGVESVVFKSIARKFSDAMFERFYQFAKMHLRKRLPLVITGGCGLNCEWNTRWLDCGLFADVFVPPCTNDSGSAIGTAIDAQLRFDGSAKLQWSVYAGMGFAADCSIHRDYERRPFSFESVAEFLAAGNVVAWVQGRYEMGPRALGNRSILASPFDERVRDRLNRIKTRESYRPIAPVCLVDELPHIADSHVPSPYMLKFYRMTTPALPAVTHVDGSARFQTVDQDQNGPLWSLLHAFRRKTGFGVLCNTSLNSKGRGCINKMSDLAPYCQATGVDGIVIGNEFYVRTRARSSYPETGRALGLMMRRDCQAV